LIGIIDAAVIDVLPVWRFGSQQVSDLRDIDGTVAVSEEAIVTDAVLASGQDVDQEPADELICGQGHGGVAACAFDGYAAPLRLALQPAAAAVRLVQQDALAGDERLAQT
jgi:hypothetical protein